MPKYFCFESDAFYCSSMHGERAMRVIDPNWSGQTVHAPMIDIPNPHTLVPAGAIEVSEAQFAALTDARARGMQLVRGADGYPVAVRRTPALPTIRASLRKGLNQQREQREQAGFPYLGKTLQADAGSRERITTAVLAALAAQAQGQAYTLAWRCADNSTLQLDVAGVLGLPMAMAQHSEALHQHCQARKTELETLDLDGLLAFNVAEGWPL